MKGLYQLRQIRFLGKNASLHLQKGDGVDDKLRAVFETHDTLCAALALELLLWFGTEGDQEAIA
eukprot:IDg1911t1